MHLAGKQPERSYEETPILSTSVLPQTIKRSGARVASNSETLVTP
jgi:hypothetical protein